MAWTLTATSGCSEFLLCSDSAIRARAVVLSRRAWPVMATSNVCERFPASLCRQALLTLRYADVTGQVICDVSVSERVMPGGMERATETIRITLRRCRTATVAASRASRRNGTTAPPCSDCPAALRVAQAPPRSTAEKQRQALRLAPPRGLGRHQVRGEPAIPVPEWQLLWGVMAAPLESTAGPHGPGRFLCLALRISCLSGQPGMGLRRDVSQPRRVLGIAPDRLAPSLGDCAGDGEQPGKNSW